MSWRCKARNPTLPLGKQCQPVPVPLVSNQPRSGAFKPDGAASFPLPAFFQRRGRTPGFVLVAGSLESLSSRYLAIQSRSGAPHPTPCSGWSLNGRGTVHIVSERRQKSGQQQHPTLMANTCSSKSSASPQNHSEQVVHIFKSARLSNVGSLA